MAAYTKLIRGKIEQKYGRPVPQTQQKTQRFDQTNPRHTH